MKVAFDFLGLQVKFSDRVQWMTLEFDPRTGFAQKEDKIGDLLIPHCSLSSSSSHTLSDSRPLSPSKHQLQQQQQGGVVSEVIGLGLEDLYADWERYSLEYPHGLVLLPGNEVHIVANVDTEYEKKDLANHFGLKCQVVGYEWTDKPSDVSLLLIKLGHVSSCIAASIAGLCTFCRCSKGNAASPMFQALLLTLFVC